MDGILSETPNYFVAASAASSLALLAVYYIFNVSQVPKIYTSSSTLSNFLSNHVPCLQDKYFPNLFFWEGRIQSILGLSQRLPSSLKLSYSREIFQLSDGGEVALDFLGPPKNQAESAPSLLVLFCPGITSSSQTSYVKTIVLAITGAGASVLVMNNRGLGGLSIKTPRLFCATATSDLKEVITHVKKNYPHQRLMGLGTSLGGMLLCKYVSEVPKGEARETFEAVLVISTCWNAVTAVSNLERPFLNQVINYGVVSNLQLLASKHRELLEPHHNFNKIMQCWSLRDFDSHFTAPHFGYSSAMDYYMACAQSVRNIHKASVPVFALNAVDDPFSQEEDLPVKEAKSERSNLVMIVTERGGHLGFLEGYSPFRRPIHLMERVVAELVRGVRLHGQELREID